MKKLIILVGLLLVSGLSAQQMTYYSGLFFDAGSTTPSSCSWPALFYNTSTSVMYGCSWDGLFHATTSGTAAIGGTNGQIQYNNSGTLGGLTPTGTGTPVLATAPTISNPTLTGNPIVQGLAYPAVTITQGGTPGTTAYTYAVTGTDAAGKTRTVYGSTTTGPATLSGTNYNIITVTAWSTSSPYVAPVGSCDVYRTVGGTTQGKLSSGIASCAAGDNIHDTGLAGSGSVPSDTSGLLNLSMPPVGPAIFSTAVFGPNFTLAAQSALNSVCAVGGGTVIVPSGTILTLTATLTIPCDGVNFIGPGVSYGSEITRTGDFGDSIYAVGRFNVHVSNFFISQTINYTAGATPPAVNVPTHGAHVHLDSCTYSSIHDNAFENMPYGIDLDRSGWIEVTRNTVFGVWDYLHSGAQISIADIYLHHTTSGTGLPTYVWIEKNVLLGAASESRTIVLNGNNITGTEPVGAKYGVWIESCEVCWVTGNTAEFHDYEGIHIASSAATYALLDIDIEYNFLDVNRLNAIGFDMSVSPSNFALNTTITHNKIRGAGVGINGVNFAAPSTPGAFVRTAHNTIITDNQIMLFRGSGIVMNSGGGTITQGNLIKSYNYSNYYPTNGLTCGANSCTGDRLGNSGVYVDQAATNFTITNNQIGGDYLGAAYNGSGIYTVNGITVGVLPQQTILSGAIQTTPNTDSGTQPVGFRSPAVFDDSAFISSTWHALTLLNGWGEGTYAPAGFRKDASGTVWLQGGFLSPGTTANATVLFTLPAGYRPANLLAIPVVTNSGTASLFMQTNGDAQLYFGAGAGYLTINSAFPTN